MNTTRQSTMTLSSEMSCCVVAPPSRQELHDAIVTLCKKGIGFHNNLQVMGVLCITVDHQPEDVVIKINNKWRRSGHVASPPSSVGDDDHVSIVSPLLTDTPSDPLSNNGDSFATAPLVSHDDMNPVPRTENTKPASPLKAAHKPDVSQVEQSPAKRKITLGDPVKDSEPPTMPTEFKEDEEKPAMSEPRLDMECEEIATAPELCQEHNALVINDDHEKAKPKPIIAQSRIKRRWSEISSSCLETEVAKGSKRSSVSEDTQLPVAKKTCGVSAMSQRIERKSKGNTDDENHSVPSDKPPPQRATLSAEAVPLAVSPHASPVSPHRRGHLVHGQKISTEDAKSLAILEDLLPKGTKEVADKLNDFRSQKVPHRSFKSEAQQDLSGEAVPLNVSPHISPVSPCRHSNLIPSRTFTAEETKSLAILGDLLPKGTKEVTDRLNLIQGKTFSAEETKSLAILGDLLPKGTKEVAAKLKEFKTREMLGKKSEQQKNQNLTNAPHWPRSGTSADNKCFKELFTMLKKHLRPPSRPAMHQQGAFANARAFENKYKTSRAQLRKLQALEMRIQKKTSPSTADKNTNKIKSEVGSDVSVSASPTSVTEPTPSASPVVFSSMATEALAAASITMATRSTGGSPSVSPMKSHMKSSRKQTNKPSSQDHVKVETLSPVSTCTLTAAPLSIGVSTKAQYRGSKDSFPSSRFVPIAPKPCPTSQPMYHFIWQAQNQHDIPRSEGDPATKTSPLPGEQPNHHVLIKGNSKADDVSTYRPVSPAIIASPTSSTSSVSSSTSSMSTQATSCYSGSVAPPSSMISTLCNSVAGKALSTPTKATSTITFAKPRTTNSQVATAVEKAGTCTSPTARAKTLTQTHVTMATESTSMATVTQPIMMSEGTHSRSPHVVTPKTPELSGVAETVRGVCKVKKKGSETSVSESGPTAPLSDVMSKSTSLVGSTSSTKLGQQLPVTEPAPSVTIATESSVSTSTRTKTTCASSALGFTASVTDVTGRTLNTTSVVSSKRSVRKNMPGESWLCSASSHDKTEKHSAMSNDVVKSEVNVVEKDSPNSFATQQASSKEGDSDSTLGEQISSKLGALLSNDILHHSASRDEDSFSSVFTDDDILAWSPGNQVAGISPSGASTIMISDDSMDIITEGDGSPVHVPFSRYGVGGPAELGRSPFKAVHKHRVSHSPGKVGDESLGFDLLESFTSKDINSGQKLDPPKDSQSGQKSDTSTPKDSYSGMKPDTASGPKSDAHKGSHLGQKSDTSKMPKGSHSGQISDHPKSSHSGPKLGISLDSHSAQKLDTPKCSHSGPKSDTPKFSHSVQKSDTPKSSYLGPKSDTPKGSHLGQKSDTPKGSHSGQKSNTPKGSHSRKSDTPKCSHLGQKSDFVMDSHLGPQSDTPKGSHSGQKLDAPKGQKSDTPKGNHSDKSDTPKGSHLGPQSDTPNSSHLGQKSNTPKGSHSGQKSDTPKGQKSDTPKGSHSGQKSDTPKGSHLGQKSDTPKSSHSGQKSNTPKGCHSGQKSDNPKGSHSRRKTDTLKCSHSGQKSDSDMDSHSGPQSDTPKGSHLGQKSDTPKGSHSGQKLDAPNRRHSGHKSDTPKGIHSGQKLGTSMDSHSGQKSDVKGNHSAQKLDRAKGSHSGQKFDNPTCSNSGGKSDNSKSSHSGQKSDTPKDSHSGQKLGTSMDSHSAQKLDSTKDRHSELTLDTRTMVTKQDVEDTKEGILSNSSEPSGQSGTQSTLNQSVKSPLIIGTLLIKEEIKSENQSSDESSIQAGKSETQDSPGENGCVSQVVKENNMNNGNVSQKVTCIEEPFKNNNGHASLKVKMPSFASKNSKTKCSTDSKKVSKHSKDYSAGKRSKSEENMNNLKLKRVNSVCAPSGKEMSPEVFYTKSKRKLEDSIDDLNVNNMPPTSCKKALDFKADRSGSNSSSQSKRQRIKSGQTDHTQNSSSSSKSKVTRGRHKTSV